VAEINLPKVPHTYLTVSLLLITILLLLMAIYSFLSWENTYVVILPPGNVSGPLANVSEEELVAKPPGYTLEGQWICGNKVVDPGETCFSCPRDIEECVCLGSFPSEFEKAVGQSFFLCHGQKAKVGGMEIQLLSVLSHTIRVYTPDGNTEKYNPEIGETFNVLYWKDALMHSYVLTLEKKTDNGVRLRADYPEKPPGSLFLLQNGQTVKISGTDMILTITMPDPNQPVLLLNIIENGVSTNMTVQPGESVSVGDSMITLFDAGDMEIGVTVNGGGGS
jgi:hypothetical protein